MDALGITMHFETSQQFWQELEELMSVDPSSSLQQLDYNLQCYLQCASKHHDDFLAEPTLEETAASLLLSSTLFLRHPDRMAKILLATVLTPQASSSESNPATDYIIPLLCLHMLGLVQAEPDTQYHYIARTSTPIFVTLRKRWEDLVPFLMDLINQSVSVIGSDAPSDRHLLRSAQLSAELLYDICRVDRSTIEELALFTEEFISRLFELVERTRYFSDETYNYTLIRLLIALNEQFMVAVLPAHSPHSHTHLHPTAPQHRRERKKEQQEMSKKNEENNTVMRVLKIKMRGSKTFGENIIWILNRASSGGSAEDLCVALLILKILYLLFTTKETSDFFYTNDLCVLIDVFIRELDDLPEENEGLRHTYLRVLYPLMTRTQLSYHAYKRPQIHRLLHSLIDSRNKFTAIDHTTKRLVERNISAPWCQELDRLGLNASPALGTVIMASENATESIPTRTKESGALRNATSTPDIRSAFLDGVSSIPISRPLYNRKDSQNDPKEDSTSTLPSGQNTSLATPHYIDDPRDDLPATSISVTRRRPPKPPEKRSRSASSTPIGTPLSPTTSLLLPVGGVKKRRPPPPAPSR